MQVRLHEAVRGNSHRSFSSRFFHEPHERVIILASVEQDALSRPAIEDVIHVTARCEAMTSRHDEIAKAIALPTPDARVEPLSGVRPRGSMNRRIAVLISGRGSNLQALIDAIADGRLDATIAIVISNKADAYGLERARAAGIETVAISHRDYPTREAFEDVLVR